MSVLYQIDTSERKHTKYIKIQVEKQVNVLENNSVIVFFMPSLVVTLILYISPQKKGNLRWIWRSG